MKVRRLACCCVTQSFSSGRSGWRDACRGREHGRRRRLANEDLGRRGVDRNNVSSQKAQRPGGGRWTWSALGWRVFKRHNDML